MFQIGKKTRKLGNLVPEISDYLQGSLFAILVSVSEYISPSALGTDTLHTHICLQTIVIGYWLFDCQQSYRDRSARERERGRKSQVYTHYNTVRMKKG